MSSGVYHKYTGYHNRRSIRLRGYDYSQPGYYFITVCIHDRKQQLFGDIVSTKFTPNKMGIIVRDEIIKTEKMRPNIKIYEYTIMPNHVHLIIQIIDSRRGTLQRAPTEDQQHSHHAPTKPHIEQFGKPTSNSIPTIVRLIKSTVTKQINILRKSPGQPVWQRNYYEHIVRDEKSLFFIRKYIRENSLNWNVDMENHIDEEITQFKQSEIEDDRQ